MNKKPRDNKETDLKNYEDLEGLTLQKMNIGLWLSLHRRKITRIVIIILIIIAAISFAYSAYSYIYYFLYGRQADTELLQNLTDNQIDSQAYRDLNAPKNLIIGDVSVFSVQGKYDFLIPLENPNARHYSNFRYCLENSAGVQVLCGDSFILPGAKKYLLLLGQELEENPGTLRLVAINMAWQRLNAHDIPDWNNYLANRADVQVLDNKYSVLESGGKNPFHSLQFTVKNNTPYHFAALPVDIILWNGTRIVGANAYNLANLLSAETRSVNLSWPSGGERVNKVEIIPDVNILNQDVYLPYRGELNP
ncbi:MAG: hypothetical protein PHG95_02630 [Patescibacteria group bacterium]|nr:hypothetical protein [Patescibacteria group bacterium]